MSKKKTADSLLAIQAPFGDEKFRRAITAEFNASVKPRAWSGDELVAHPHSALEFCDAVRQRLAFFGLPNDLILRTLINIRRKGKGEVNIGEEVAT